jgi:hypothetical protein
MKNFDNNVIPEQTKNAETNKYNEQNLAVFLTVCFFIAFIFLVI